MSKRTVIVLREIEGGITAPEGFKASATHCGLKRHREDIALVSSAMPGSTAGVFTRNQVKAAPVIECQNRVSGGSLQAILIVSGNANACTGEAGLANAYRLTEVVGAALGIDAKLVASTMTGVIGVPLPMGKIEPVVPALVDGLSEESHKKAALAIMTTDTRPKESAVEFDIDSHRVRIGGMAKGSGMIHPDMATTLCFVSTDAAIPAPLLQKTLESACDKSFNMITVDGDTSTNDSILVIANGMSGAPEIAEGTEAYETFFEGFLKVLTDLAKAVVSDGEGATKLIEVRVKGARSYEDARKVAKTVANSNLVKTAIFGEDANWGRILCAVGYSGTKIDPLAVDISIGPIQVCKDGAGTDFDEAAASEVLRETEIKLDIDLGMGGEEAIVWTCDLTYDYVKINASYRS